ncbi:zinc-binding alcohol dehydrogenase family protein [Paenibacillus sp. GCM10027627]|uniref:quinone oxidoreductase family protein n=1 Tax=unclassified Paenibacillus TaxID=185978 RepID=UPI003641A3B9
MKAIVVEGFGPTDFMKYAEVDIPSIAPNQVLIKVKATSVNFADIKSRRGEKGEGKLPFIPGLEAAGVVEAVGESVTSIVPGQRVIAFPHQGSYAEYAAADESLTFPVPDGLDLVAAGGYGIVSFLSYQLLADVARLQSGETVLIHSAAGGVGSTAIQIAKALGASNVIGTVGAENKIEAAKMAGADEVVCYETEDLAAKIAELTGGAGADVILDSLGGDMTNKSLSCLAPFGRLVVFGNSSGSYSGLQTKDLHASCRSVLGFSFGTTRKKRPERLHQTAAEVFKLIESGKLEVAIHRTFPLQEAASAHQWVESRQSTGKVLLVMDNE